MYYVPMQSVSQSMMAAAPSSNPLDDWRGQSRGNKQALQELLFGQEIIDYKTNIWDTLTSDPLFGDHGNDLTLHEKRELTFHRLQKLCAFDFLPDEVILDNPRKFLAFNDAIQTIDGSLLPVYVLNTEVGVVSPAH